MKVLMINGSPHKQGCTFTALQEVATALQKHEIQYEIMWLGVEPIAGCIGCGFCRKTGQCFRNDAVNKLIECLEDFDGFVFGSPVHYSAASGALTSFLDRLFFAAGAKFAGKPGLSVVSARRAGTTAALDQVNKYMIINNMPLVPSQYWPMVHGTNPDEVKSDAEGMQIMRQGGNNLAWLLKCIAAGQQAGIEREIETPRVSTNFIRL